MCPLHTWHCASYLAQHQWTFMLHSQVHGADHGEAQPLELCNSALNWRAWLSRTRAG